MTPEGKVKKKVRKFLDERRIYYTMGNTGGYGSSGATDFIICFQGRFIGIECKANGNMPTALQYSHMERIVENGGIAYIVDESNVDSLPDFFHKLEV